MSHRRLQHFFLGLFSALVIGANAQAFAYVESPAAFQEEDDLFFNEEPIGNEELDEMRGGFVTRNGMVIDFSFSANTLIDGRSLPD